MLEGATFQMQQLYLQSRGSGEMLDITVTDDGSIVAVGRDNSESFPLIYTCSAGSDCYTADGWTRAELDLFFIDPFWTSPAGGSSDGRAVASSGNVVVATGNFVPNGQGGWALLSKDGGKTWEDLTATLLALQPQKNRVPNIYDVHVFESGKILLMGETSFIYNP